MAESKRLFCRSLPAPLERRLMVAFTVFNLLALAVRVLIAIKTGKHAPGLAWASLGLSLAGLNPVGALLFVIYRHREGSFSTLDNTYIVLSVLWVGFTFIYPPIFWGVISPFGYQAWVASFNEDGVLAKRYKWWWKFILWA